MESLLDIKLFHKFSGNEMTNPFIFDSFYCRPEEAGQSNINATHPNHIIHSLLLYGLFSVLLSPTWNSWKIVGWSDVI